MSCLSSCILIWLQSTVLQCTLAPKSTGNISFFLLKISEGPRRFMTRVMDIPPWLIYFKPLRLQRQIYNPPIFRGCPLFFTQPSPTTHTSKLPLRSCQFTLSIREGQRRFMPRAKCVYSNSSPVSALSETDTHKHRTSEWLQQLTSEGLNPSGSGSNRLDYVIATICYEK